MVPKWFSSAPLLGLHSSLHGVVQPAGGSVMSGLDKILEQKYGFYWLSHLRCVLRKVVWWSDSKSDQYLRGGRHLQLRESRNFEEDSPGHLVLLLFQVFDLQVEVWQFLIDPIQSRPDHSETKHRY